MPFSFELTRFFPKGLRMRVKGAVHNARELRRSVFLPFRPTFQARHTSEELQQISQEWAERRVAWAKAGLLDGAVGMISQAPILRAEVWYAEAIAVDRPGVDAVTLTFRQPPESSRRFVAGQFLTLVLEIDGEEVRRAYSYCSDPNDAGQFSLTIKRVEGGLVSNFINDRAEVGWKVKVLGPSGRFGASLSEANERKVVMIAGGVGCTPLLSMAYQRLQEETQAPLTFLYANVSPRRDGVLFADTLAALCDEHPQMTLHHLFDDIPDGEVAGAPVDAWVSASPREEAHWGRLEGDAMPHWLPVDTEAHYFVCGPTGLMDNVREHLLAGGVSEAQIEQEAFVDQSQSGLQTYGATGAVYEMRRGNGAGGVVAIEDHKTLLDVGLEAGWEMDHSCQMGGCAACKVKVLEGEVAMPEPHCLTREERAKGYCLACIAQPRSHVVIELPDDEI